MTYGTFADWATRAHIFSQLAAIMGRYDFSPDKGLVTCVGPHENNPPHTIYFSDIAEEGLGEAIGPNTVIFEPTPIEREIFGAMPGKPLFEVSWDENGFVYGQWIDGALAEKLRTDAALAEAERGDDD